MSAMIWLAWLSVMYFAITPAASGAENWAVVGAPWRVSLSAVVVPDAPQAGWEIRLPDFGGGRDDMRDVVLLGEDGKEIGLHGVWRGAGTTLLVLAESMPAAGSATLYFGGNAPRRTRSWQATPSLLMETRRMPAEARIASYAGWQDAWRKSAAVDGVAFVPQVFHGGNPFGGESRYLTRYAGLLKTGEGGMVKFYSLSDDVSYVKIDGRPVLQWAKDAPPSRDPKKVPLADVRLSKGLAQVEYAHAAVEAPGAMALGWEKDGKLGNVPPEAWVHPGRVKAGEFESADGLPVPLGQLEAESYLGYAGEWYVKVKASVPDPGDGWQVEWLWPDGRVDHGAVVHRLWMSLDPLRVVVRIKKGAQHVEGWRLFVIPREMKAASVNNKQDLAGFLELLDNEDPKSLSIPVQRAGWLLAADFQDPSSAARWAEAWLAGAPPTGGHWAEAMIRVIRDLGRKDAQAALGRIDRLSAEARKVLGREVETLELDLRVFGLNDPMVLGLVAKCRSGSDKILAQRALNRLGDYHLRNGRVEDAARCYSEAATPGKDVERKAPVIDRAHSLAIENMLDGGFAHEARTKLDEWERLRPQAKIDGDQLLWRARVLLLEQDAKRALLDLETIRRVRSGSPEEIEVLFWQGRALYELGKKDEARTMWEALRTEYPKHERAEAAKLWMEKP